MTSAVMGDATVAALGQKEHLVFKGIRRQRPSVTEDYGLSGSPILVVNLRSIFRCNSTHETLSFLCCAVRHLKFPEFARAA